METKQEKIEMLQTAIKQLIDDEKRSFKDVLIADEDKEFDHRLLSKLLSQVETLREENLLHEDTKLTCHDNENESRTKDFPEPEDIQPEKKAEVEERRDGNEERREEEIINEIRNVKRQNFITHCLLSVIFLLTVTWQLSEVSMIMKVKESLNHPIRSIGGMITGMLKKPVASTGNGKEDEKQHTFIETSIPGIKLPILPQLDLPSLDFDRE